MRFDVGFWDRLFGEKTVLNIPGPNGGRQVKGSLKWLAKMEAEGKLSPTGDDCVTAHILDPLGAARAGFGLEGPASDYRTETWVIGRDVSRETVDQFADPKTKDLFVLVQWKNGESAQHAVRRDIWQQAKDAFDAL